MPRPKKRDPSQPKLTKRQRALLEALVAYDNLRRTDIVDELNDLTRMGLVEFDYEGPSEPTEAGRALVQVETTLRTWQQERAEVIAFAKKLFGEHGDEHEWIATRNSLLSFLKRLEAGAHVSGPGEEEPETRDYKEDAAELAGAVIGFIDQIMNEQGSISNDHAYLLQFAEDVLAGNPEG